jgi:hypothetical protein
MGNIFCDEINKIPIISKLNSYYYKKYIESFYNLINVYNQYTDILKKNKQINSNNLKELYISMNDANLKLGEAMINESHNFYELEFYMNNRENMIEIFNEYKIIRDNSLKYGVENFITSHKVHIYIDMFNQLRQIV